jgi:heat shock protein HslJ
MLTVCLLRPIPIGLVVRSLSVNESEENMNSRKKIRVLLLAALMLILAACAPQAPQVPITGQTPTSETPGLPPRVILDAQQWLATQLSVAIEQVRIVEVEQAEWTDSCLGLGRPDESCLQVMTPGWRANFEVNGRSYEVRTDETGSIIRLASLEGAQPSETGLENTHWSLVSFGSPGAERPLVEGSTITLMLAAGQAGGSGGCNSYGGTYQVDGTSISFGDITSTLLACADASITEQEQRYFQALESAGQYEVVGDQLRITYDDGNGLMIFETALPVSPEPAVETPGS